MQLSAFLHKILSGFRAWIQFIIYN